MLDALIFDLDGTLVDTNGMHARAWSAVFARHGFEVPPERVIVEIGKGGELLVPALVGEEAEEELGEALRDGHGEEFLRLVEREPVRVFARVRDLLGAVRERGVALAVATASQRDHLERVLERAGLDLEGLADAVIDDDDVERPKPEPDVVAAAVRKLGLPADRCALVGDTPYDALAARRAGVVALGVLTGVHPEERLREAGARAVFVDPADLLGRLDDTLALRV